jgi:hypothetical protein
MPPLRNAIERYATVMRESDFAAEAEASIDGGRPRHRLQPAGRQA